MNTHRILFLCSGNYYRSRMAEEFFNNIAGNAQSAWHADSRGLNQFLGNNQGPMSVDAIKLLTNDGVTVVNGKRYPIPISERDFLESKLIVAMSKAEHEPMIMRDWGQYRDRVQYWDVEDMHLEKPSVAYEKVKGHVRKLFDMLNKNDMS
jgi:protein-tyrosine phosphatase